MMVADTVFEASAGPDYVRRRILDEFPLAKHIGIEVDCADDAGVVLRAPFGPNANFKGTAFGGSLFCVAVLAGWAWTTRYLAARHIAADALIQESSIRYLAPVQGELCARLEAPPLEQVDRFRRTLRRAGRGRIRLQVLVRDGSTLATRFDGVFVAMIR
ncbi:MAG TPA: YiiD C-terminal domain-containing protein [Steroidobacteraceae bacterium]|nr:YiiD C-terminal domain-containing protein [Steroidobacteraceae bacterium]